MKSIVILAGLLVSCDSKPPDPSPIPDPAIVVLAASSLKEVVTEIAAHWTEQTGREVRTQFEASSTLARQIGEGAPADLFISAAPEWLDKVKPVERFDWLSNRLVAVARKGAEVDLKKLESLALANEQVPAGKYAKAALQHQGIAIPERTLYGSNVRDVLSKVVEGGAQVGIVYATDVALVPDLVIVFTFPPESHPKILYCAGLITTRGKSLFESIREKWALEIATRHGFEK